MGNLVGKITTDAGPLDDEINCDCSRSPTPVYNAAQRGARRPTTNNVYIDHQHRSRSQSKVYICNTRTPVQTTNPVELFMALSYLDHLDMVLDRDSDTLTFKVIRPRIYLCHSNQYRSQI